MITGVPFGYRCGNTLLHRIPAGVKLVLVIVLSIAAYIDLYSLAFVVVMVLIASVIAKVSLRVLLKGSKPFLIIALLVLAVKTVDLNIPAFSFDGFLAGLVFVIRIFIIYSVTALFFAVTTMRELRFSLSKLELRLKKKGNIAFLSLGICLMLGFIPRFFDIWENSNTACKARSGIKHGNPFRKLQRIFFLVPLVSERMMEFAAYTIDALEARALGEKTEY